MFTKKFSELLIKCRSLSLLQRLDSTLTCASHQNKFNYFQRSCKYLCTSSLEHENLIDSKENNLNTVYFFAVGRKVLLNSEIYSKNLATSLKLRDSIKIDDINEFLMKPWISMSNTELLENFEILSNYAKKNEKNLVNPEFDGVLEVIQSRCSNFSDDELYHLLKCLEFWIFDKEDKKCKNFWKCIDKECFNRFRTWSIDKVLLFNDLFYKLRLSRGSDFTYHSLKKLGHKPEKLSRQNLIHYAFLTNVNRKMVINLYNHEYYIEKKFDELSLEEFGLFASTITYYESTIKSKELLKNLIKKLQKEIDTISDFALIKNLQILRLVNDEEFIRELKVLYEVMEVKALHRHLGIIKEFANLQGKTSVLSPSLMQKILDRFEEDLKKPNIKEFEIVTKALTKFNYNPKNCKFYSLMMNELLSPDRVANIDQFPYPFLKILYHLAQVNFYSEEALKIILDPKLVEKTCKGEMYNLPKEFLLLHFFIELEHPEYKGPRLPNEYLENLMMRFGAIRMEKINKVQKMNRTGKMIKEITDACKQAFNSESAAIADALLPQFAKLDVVLCKDPSGNIVSVEDKFLQVPLGTIKYAPKDGNKWYALVAVAHPSLTKDDLPVGLMSMELKHLELIGYTPILIYKNKWQNLDEEGRQKYIKEILSR